MKFPLNYIVFLVSETLIFWQELRLSLLTTDPVNELEEFGSQENGHFMFVTRD